MFEIGLIEESLVTVDFEVIDPATDKVAGVLTVTYDRNMFSGEYDRRQGRSYADRIRAIDNYIKSRFFPSVQIPAKSKSSSKKKIAATAQESAPQNNLIRLADDYMSARETDAMVHDVHREVMAESLACNRCFITDCKKESHERCGVIKSWSAVRGGVPVEPTYEELARKPLSFLVDLEQFLRSYALPKEARTLRLRTTSDNIDDTSASEPDIQTAENQTM